MEKMNLILDTDISNEVDDQFALTYLMKSIDLFNLEAITIAPFGHSGYKKTKSIYEGTELSFNTAGKILDMLDFSEYKSKIYKGATKYFFESKELNPATKKIIEIARKNDYTYIAAIGAITNIALALYLAPDIAERIEIVWLGGNSFLSELNKEFNFRQDVEAVRAVFNSKAKVTVIPCRNVATNLTTTIYELEHYIKDKGEIGAYLCQIFKECKKAFTNTPLDEIGQAKTLWDISVIAYLINKDWFVTKNYSCPEILDDTSYKMTIGKHTITFVNDILRHPIFQDFFVKMGVKY